MVRKKDKKRQLAISVERIGILFGLAEEAAKDGDLMQANQYVVQARKISMRTNKPIPTKYKRMICSHCYHYMISGVNSQTRLDKNHDRVNVKCLDCGGYTYYPFVKEKSGKKS